MKKLFVGLMCLALVLFPCQNVFSLSNSWPDDDARVDGSVDTMDEVDDFINTLSLDIHERILATDGETVQIQTNWTAAGKTCANLGTVTTTGTIGLGGKLTAGATEIEGSNFDINGGVITGITDLVVADGGTGAGTFTDGGILLGSGTSAITALGALADGSIVVGDGTTDPVALAAFSSSTGDVNVAAGGTGISTDDKLVQCWVNFAGSSSINDSYNVDSVTDNGTGNFTITWTTDFADTSYVIAGSGDRGDPNDFIAVTIISLATGTANVNTRDSGNLRDANPTTVLAVGNQ